MRWSSRRDGTIAVYDDVYPNDDLLVVEPIVTTFTPTHGNGRWLAIRGRGYKRQSQGVEQVIHAPLRAHSQKPDEIAERIERLVGDVPRIELFARTRRPGWSAWGNEVDTQWGRRMRICGVDPGLAGAAGMPELIDAIDLPLAGVAAKTRIDMLALRAWIETHKPDCAVIDGSMPRQGVASTFKFGRATGAIEATVAFCGVPMSVVEASVWKRRFGLYGTEKEASRLLAIQKISCLARAVQSAATPQSRRSGADRARIDSRNIRARGKSAVGGADLSDIHSQIGEHHDTAA